MMSSPGGRPSWQAMVSVRSFRRSARVRPVVRGRAGHNLPLRHRRSQPQCTTSQCPGPEGLASAVRCRLGVRICHLNCEDSADPGTSRVYLEAASPQVSTLQRNRGRPESSWLDRHESPHTAP